MKGTQVSKYHGQSGEHHLNSELVFDGKVLCLEAIDFKESGILEDDLIFTYEDADGNDVAAVRRAYPFAQANWPHNYVAFRDDAGSIACVFNAMFLKGSNGKLELKTLDEVIKSLEQAKKSGERCGDVRAARYEANFYFW